jgi:hypothetical protein
MRGLYPQYDRTEIRAMAVNKMAPTRKNLINLMSQSMTRRTQTVVSCNPIVHANSAANIGSYLQYIQRELKETNEHIEGNGHDERDVHDRLCECACKQKICG